MSYFVLQADVAHQTSTFKQYGTGGNSAAVRTRHHGNGNNDQLSCVTDFVYIIVYTSILCLVNFKIIFKYWNESFGGTQNRKHMKMSTL